MRQNKGAIPVNKVIWTQDMITYLKQNWDKLTNQQLADNLGLKKTVTRNKLRELGLFRMKLEYWSEDMITFLKTSYKIIGDVEIMKFFIKHHPKTKGWKRGAIWKKRKQMGLIRTEKEKKAIEAKHHKKGGPSYTIDKNSSSKNMHPRWIAQQIAWRNPEMQLELMKHPEIIEAAKQILLLKRKIKSLNGVTKEHNK